MKISRIILSILVVAISLGAVSCREKELIADDVFIPGLGGTDEATNELDTWLYDNFTKPYNISVTYRWNAAQMYSTITSSRLVPVEYDMVKPTLAAIRDVWFSPFNEAAGPAFMRQLAPKTLVLVGSPEYSNGAIKLGEAEGGNKVLLLNINYFDATDSVALTKQLHTILHEFGHILHQAKMYDKAFRDISVGLYEPDAWKEFTDKEAWQLGFIRNYAMNCVDDDFVDLLAGILVYGYDWFENTVLPVAAASEDNPHAASDLIEKLEILESYLLNSWNIKLFDDSLTGEKGLETYVQEAVAKVIDNPPVE